MTVPGRRNNFYKSLEKKVLGLLINQYHWSTLGGGEHKEGTIVRVSDFNHSHLKSIHFLFALSKLNIFKCGMEHYLPDYSPL